MKHLLTLTSSRLIASLSQAVNLILLARGITPAEFGAASAFLGVCLFLMVLADFGVSTLVLRHGAFAVTGQEPSATYVASGLVTSWIQAVGLSLVCAVTGVVLFPGLPLFFTLIVSVWVGSERVFETILSGLVARGAVTRSSVLLLLRRLPALAVQVALIVVGFDGIAAFTWGLPVGMAMGALALLGTSRPRLHRPFAFPFRETAQYWVAATSSQSRELETPVVQLAAGAGAAGLYSVAFKLQKPIVIAAVSAAQLILPAVSVDVSSARSAARRLWLAIGLVALVTAVTLPFTEAIIVLVLGEAYASAILVAQIGLIVAVPFAFCAPFGAILQAAGRAAEVASLGLVIAAVSLVLTAGGALIAGAAGAMAACGACYAVKLTILAWRVAGISPAVESYGATD